MGAAAWFLHLKCLDLIGVKVSGRSTLYKINAEQGSVQVRLNNGMFIWEFTRRHCILLEQEAHYSRKWHYLCQSQEVIARKRRCCQKFKNYQEIGQVANNLGSKLKQRLETECPIILLFLGLWMWLERENCDCRWILKLNRGSFGGIVIPCIRLPLPVDISWCPPMRFLPSISTQWKRGEEKSVSSLFFLQATSWPHAYNLLPSSSSEAHGIFFYDWSYFHFLICKQKLQGLTVILKIFILFDLEIFKNIFEFFLEKFLKDLAFLNSSKLEVYVNHGKKIHSFL